MDGRIGSTLAAGGCLPCAGIAPLANRCADSRFLPEREERGTVTVGGKLLRRCACSAADEVKRWSDTLRGSGEW